MTPLDWTRHASLFAGVLVQTVFIACYLTRPWTSSWPTISVMIHAISLWAIYTVLAARHLVDYLSASPPWNDRPLPHYHLMDRLVVAILWFVVLAGLTQLIALLHEMRKTYVGRKSAK